mmetsp:Transcript_35670/g.71511  ORF Transcript_35670/g.71511 Transcript_35670/m.71511 type:complete len:210 (-) Transcript_35670:8-637(-)
MRPRTAPQPSSLDSVGTAWPHRPCPARFAARNLCSATQALLPVPPCIRLPASPDAPPATRNPALGATSAPPDTNLEARVRAATAPSTMAAQTRGVSTHEAYMALASAAATGTSAARQHETNGPATLMSPTAAFPLHSVHVPATSHASNRFPFAREYSPPDSENSEHSSLHDTVMHLLSDSITVHDRPSSSRRPATRDAPCATANTCIPE